MASWYSATRQEFLGDSTEIIVSRLHQQAATGGWHVEPDQDEEWRSSIDDLKAALNDRTLAFIEGVLVEYDFRRRGLRVDFILICPGLLYVLEFKRGQGSGADRDQVLNYCVNLVEFHQLTQSSSCRLFPVLVARRSASGQSEARVEWHDDWPRICRNVIHTTSATLRDALLRLQPYANTSDERFTHAQWDESPFHPSSTIVDATISLYGQHDVSAIREHAVPKKAIDRCIAAVIAEIDAATEANRHLGCSRLRKDPRRSRHSVSWQIPRRRCVRDR